MENQSKLHHRRSMRLNGYDYSLPGAYFVTIVSYQRLPFFGEIIAGEVKLNHIGIFVENCWKEIPSHSPEVSLDAHIIMPNHIHGVVNINDDHIESTKHKLLDPTKIKKTSQNQPKQHALGAIIGSFKSSATRKMRQSQINLTKPIWQRNYYEHIIRNEDDYDRIFEYIQNNPINWENDEEFFLSHPSQLHTV